MIVEPDFRRRYLPRNKPHHHRDVGERNRESIKPDELVASVVIQRGHQVATHALKGGRGPWGAP